jgi:hypothetical protein
VLDAAPPPTNVIVVESTPNHSPLVMMGFAVIGHDSSLAKVEAAATKVGLPSQRMPGPTNGVEVAIVFPPASARSAALSLYHDAVNGKFGKLNTEVMVVPLAVYQRGEDIGDAAQAVSPDFIVDPKN